MKDTRRQVKVLEKRKRAGAHHVRRVVGFISDELEEEDM